LLRVTGEPTSSKAPRPCSSAPPEIRH
jgi:hypothetical protein